MSAKFESFSYSVITPYYSKVEKEHFIRSIESGLRQTIPPKEVILVQDGPVPDVLKEVSNFYLKKHPDIFKLVVLEENSGSGIARREAVLASITDWIAPLDADDVVVSNRIEIEYNKLCEDPELDIISSVYCEFSGKAENVVLRHSPESQEELIKYAKRQNPFGHSSMLIRKSKILEVGNYRKYNLCEDYDLWIRMLIAGAKCYNFQIPLTYLRANEDYYNRRNGLTYLKVIMGFLNEHRKAGFFSTKEFIVTATMRCTVYLLPLSFRKFIYRRMLRKNIATEMNDNHRELKEIEEIDFRNIKE